MLFCLKYCIIFANSEKKLKNKWTVDKYSDVYLY